MHATPILGPCVLSNRVCKSGVFALKSKAVVKSYCLKQVTALRLSWGKYAELQLITHCQVGGVLNTVADSHMTEIATPCLATSAEYIEDKLHRWLDKC